MTIAGHVAHLVIDHGSGNAVDIELATALVRSAEQVRELVTKGTSTVVVVRSRGANFCVGGDLRAFVAVGDDVGTFVARLANTVHDALRILAGLPAPIVVAVRGAVAGVGIGIALAGDVLLAGRSASFTLAYSAVGLSPDGGASWLLPRILGPRRAAEFALTRRSLSAAEALDWGLVTQVVEDGRLDDAVAAVVEQLAAVPPGTLARTKKLLAEAERRSFEEHLDLESAAIAESAADPRSRALVTAFLDTRRSRA
ncbi:hypothetical protein FrCorBMG51_22120 [Protofrankia coriariae]|uniref:2-(1,2-epoxy-1,2-dihydrophenyl)acetyl-CoA isomerase n=1 Tax=Protofrankia coriariae TaxID=1562887 RepID=A0ABR5EZF2_9ACTN|nr:hypothetical protein FrCorBMG51_22120 [Protofrankia coriariae]